MARLPAGKLCFVIGPIGSHKSEDRVHADTLLKKIIKPTFAKHFTIFNVERADEISRPGLIDSQVITHLIEADLVVADLTGRNANAFYELGIRHMLQKPVIHLYRRGDVIPADIAPYRAIEFSDSDKWEIRDAKQALRRAVSEVLLPNFFIENPVTRSVGFIRLQSQQQSKPKAKRALKKRRPLGPPAPRLIKTGPHLENAPNVQWEKTIDGLLIAVWSAPKEAVKRGFRPKWVRLWSGDEASLNKTARALISDFSNNLAGEVQIWSSTSSR